MICLVALVLLSPGCRRGRLQAMRAESSAALRAMAAHDLSCRSTLSTVALDLRVAQVTGCGQTREYARSERTRGDVVWTAVEPIATRAEREMQCDVASLTLTAPWATVRRVSGCGREARYDLMCGADACAWAMTQHSGARIASRAAPVLSVAVATPVDGTTVGAEAPVPEWYRTASASGPPMLPSAVSAPSPSTSATDDEGRLRALASESLGCSELTLTVLRPRVVQVYGCGRLVEYASSSADASAWAPLASVVDVAHREMTCAADDLAVTALAATMRTVVGCGRSARYELVCEGECGWRMTAHAGAWSEGQAGDE
jgi:hypothetical protein